jgi:hypothetical protein
MRDFEIASSLLLQKLMPQHCEHFSQESIPLHSANLNLCRMDSSWSRGVKLFPGKSSRRAGRHVLDVRKRLDIETTATAQIKRVGRS